MADLKDLTIVIRGAGEMATGTAHRLASCHFRVLCTERPDPLAVRRRVSFCEAIGQGTVRVEGVTARQVSGLDEAEEAWAADEAPILVDPDLACLTALKPEVLVEASLTKKNTFGLRADWAPLVIALGPGFSAPEEAFFVIETNRGHNLGRLITSGRAEADTGAPGAIEGYTWQRVFRAPADGVFETERAIGDLVEEGETVGQMGGQPVSAGVAGMIRGLIRSETRVSQGLKLGDVDPRGARAFPDRISEKARAVGGSVLECILRIYNT